MISVEMEYLEHGKFFQKNLIPSDFYDLAYTSDLSRFSKDLRDAVGLDLKTPFSEKPGRVSFAFIPVLGRSRYSFVQFQSRFEGEYGGSSTNRPFFQTKFLIYGVAEWRSLYEHGLSVFPSLIQDSNESDNLLTTFSSVAGNIGKSRSVNISESDDRNNLFFQYSRSRDREILLRISAIANAVLEYKNVGGVNIRYNRPLSEKLMLIDAVMCTLLPVVKEPISFALDPACTVKVDLRFVDDFQHRGAAFNLDLSTSSLLQMDGDVGELVKILADNTSDWQALHNKLYFGFPKVVELREKRKEKEALLFLVSLLKKNYAKIFNNTTGLYDDEIVQLMSSNDYENVLQSGNDDVRVRFLGNSWIQRLDVKQWFVLLQISSLSPLRIKNVISQYLEKKQERFSEVCLYFGKLSNRKLSHFTVDDDQNVLYDSLKKLFQNRKKILEQSVSGQGLDLHTLQKTDELKHVLNGIKNLPSGYDRVEEMWFWATEPIISFHNQGWAISASLAKLGVDINDFPDLFLKALSSLRISREELNETDSRWVNAFAEKGVPEFLQLKDILDSKLEIEDKSPKYNQHTSVAPIAGNVYILEQARREQEAREQASISDEAVSASSPQKDRTSFFKWIFKKKKHSRQPQVKSQIENQMAKESRFDGIKRQEIIAPVSIWVLSLLSIVLCFLIIIFWWIVDWLNHLHRFR